MVSIRIAGLAVENAHRAVETGFQAIAEIHARMSFHEAGSDVSRLNRGAAACAVRVHADTFAVVRRALEVAEASGGAFDPTIGAQLVSWAYLPPPSRGAPPDRRASWRDIELIDPDRIRFHRPLWLDLGGIAKGYAVDRAIARMALDPDIQCCVNAGGDLRVVGPHEERVLLRVPARDGLVPMVTIENGSIASSSGRTTRKQHRGETVGPHVDIQRRRAMGTRSFVSVIAPVCLNADALTKVVLALGARSIGVLNRFGAMAYVHSGRGWRTIGA
jgi:FAD:protein FMN transferase